MLTEVRKFGEGEAELGMRSLSKHNKTINVTPLTTSGRLLGAGCPTLFSSSPSPHPGL